MVSKQAVIKNEMGIHVRPTGIIIQEAGRYTCDITVSAHGIDTDLKDHMGLLALGLCKGDTVDITVTGPDEEKICNVFVELFQREFDFPPRNA